MVKLVDTLDLKSSEQQCSCGFKSRSEYKREILKRVSLFLCFKMKVPFSYPIISYRIPIYDFKIPRRKIGII